MKVIVFSFPWQDLLAKHDPRSLPSNRGWRQFHPNRLLKWVVKLSSLANRFWHPHLSVPGIKGPHMNLFSPLWSFLCRFCFFKHGKFLRASWAHKRTGFVVSSLLALECGSLCESLLAAITLKFELGRVRDLLYPAWDRCKRRIAIEAFSVPF
jgi:hypothetical protein